MKYFFPSSLKAFAYLFMLVMVVPLLNSCQKDNHTLQENLDSVQHSHIIDRTSPTDADVVSYAQWAIDHVSPLVSDHEVMMDIENGEYYSENVEAKLASLGFEDFNDFVEQLNEAGGVVFTALNNGNISQATFKQMLRDNIFAIDFTPIGGSGTGTQERGLPCYEQFLDDMAAATLAGLMASISNPIAGAATLAIGYGLAYATFKNCISAYGLHLKGADESPMLNDKLLPDIPDPLIISHHTC